MLNVKKFFVREDGAAAIEFAVVAFPFIVSILFIMELCRVVYIMSSVDLILSDTANATAILSSSADKKNYFEKHVNDVSKKWMLLLAKDNVKVESTIKYCETIDSLINAQCTDTYSPTASIGLYKINVPYEPLFFVFPTKLIQRHMGRTIALIQEHNLTR